MLIIEDEPPLLDLLQQLVATIGCEVVGAATLGEARGLLKTAPHCAVVLTDQRLPDGMGLDFCKELRAFYPNSIRILSTGFIETDVLLQAINQGEIFRFITKPYNAENVLTLVRDGIARWKTDRENERLKTALIQKNEQLGNANTKLAAALDNSVDLCMDIMDRYDHLLAGHGERVARWCIAMGRELHLSETEIDTLRIAALMHDIGLVSVEREFHKRQQVGWEKLQAVQKAGLTSHPATSAQVVQFHPNQAVAEVVKCHHEWFNGNGYPEGIAYDRIPFLAAILAVPDAYDELPYMRQDTKEFIERNVSVRFHPEAARIFLHLFDNRPEFGEREREVTVSQMAEGMKLTNNVYNSLGVLLVPKGTALTDRHIMRLRQYNATEPIAQRIFISA